MPSLTNLLQCGYERTVSVRVRRLINAAVARFQETEILEVASSMTLATLLSIVPLLAVAAAMFSIIPAFESYREQLELTLVDMIPGEYSVQIFYYLKSFSDHAKGLSAFGFAGLAVSAFFLLDKVFKTINRLFRVRHKRSVMKRAVYYLAFLVLGPVVMATSITLTTGLTKQMLSAVSSEFSTTGFMLLGLFLQTFFYAVLFKLVPNCHVPMKHAFFGGFLTALAGMIVRWGFTIYISSGTLASLYGAFVALPVFILWIYVSWILIFAGAAVTATVPMVACGRFADSCKTGNSFVTGIAILRVLWEDHERGVPMTEIRVLCKRVDSWTEAVSAIMEKLMRAGYAQRVKGRKPGYRLSVDPEKETLKGAFGVLAVDPTIELFDEETDCDFSWYERLMASPVLNEPLSKVFASGEDKTV